MNILSSSELRSALNRALTSIQDSYRWESDEIENKALVVLAEFVERLGQELS